MHREIVQAFGHHRESGGDQLDDSAIHEGRELALTFNFRADRLSPLYDLAGHPQVTFTFRREIAGDGVRIRLLDLALDTRGAEIKHDILGIEHSMLLRSEKLRRGTEMVRVGNSRVSQYAQKKKK